MSSCELALHRNCGG